MAELRKRIFFSTICVRRIKTALFSKSGRKNFSFYVEGKTVWNAPLLICYRYGIIPHHSWPIRSKANAIYNLVPRETPLQFGYWFYLEKVFFFLVILLLLIKSFFTLFFLWKFIKTVLNNLWTSWEYRTLFSWQLTADEQERRRIRRERNKVAASKCRKKRKEHVKTLVEVSGYRIYSINRPGCSVIGCSRLFCNKIINKITPWRCTIDGEFRDCKPVKK